MSDLRALQAELTQAMLSAMPLPPSALQGDTLASAESRLAIHHRGYRLRLREALATEFPGLALMMGRRFNSMLDSYVEAHPSGHYNIRWHGGGLAAFLGQASPWCDQPALAQMAEFDWAISMAFDAADETSIAVAELSRVPPEAWGGLHLHPLSHMQCIALTCNADAFRRAADRGLSRPKLRRRVRPCHFLVWRPEREVRYRRAEAGELPAVLGLLQGESFSQLCERLAETHTPGSAPQHMAFHLFRWLGDGLIGRFDVGVRSPM